MFETLKKNILYLHGLSLWFLTLIGTILIAPKIVSPYITENTIKVIAGFLITALIVTMVFYFKKSQSKRKRKYYLLVSWLALLIGTISLFYYLHVLEIKTVEYPQGSGNTVVIGNYYTEEVAKLYKTNEWNLSSATPAELVENFPPKGLSMTHIWNANEIRQNGYFLIALFIFTSLNFVAFLFLVTHVITIKIPENAPAT